MSRYVGMVVTVLRAAAQATIVMRVRGTCGGPDAPVNRRYRSDDLPRARQGWACPDTCCGRVRGDSR